VLEGVVDMRFKYQKSWMVSQFPGFSARALRFSWQTLRYKPLLSKK
jgi:hypothetical protein